MKIIHSVGGQEKIRRLWKHYYENATAIIFVVDSNDVERVEEARKELHTMLDSDELKSSILLVSNTKLIDVLIYDILIMLPYICNIRCLRINKICHVLYRTKCWLTDLI